MLIPSVFVSERRNESSLSRRVNANSQLSEIDPSTGTQAYQEG